MRRIALPEARAALEAYEPDVLRSILLVIPGGRCAARRYGWLSALTANGTGVYVLDGANSSGEQSDGPSPMILQLAEAVAWLAGKGLPIHTTGHSAGAAALLDALDPTSNSAARLPHGFALPAPLASVTVLGCALQSRTLGIDFPHRSDDKPLHIPAATRLLFIAGERDAMAPPELVARTAARFDPPAGVVVLSDATHYGWAGAREDGDQARSDADPTLDTASQRERTLGHLADVIAERPPNIADCWPDT